MWEEMRVPMSFGTLLSFIFRFCLWRGRDGGGVFYV
jgi:hypothetical protein